MKGWICERDRGFKGSGRGGAFSRRKPRHSGEERPGRREGGKWRGPEARALFARNNDSQPRHLRGRRFRRPSPRGRTTEAVPLREPGRSRLTPSAVPDPGGAALLARRLNGSRLRASASADADSPAAAEVAAALPWRSIGAPSRPAPIRSSRHCRPSQPPSAASPSSQPAERKRTRTAASSVAPT